jgi:hypothetical protein
MLIAITTKFDLEIKQYDVINTFVHAAINREIYIRILKEY